MTLLDSFLADIRRQLDQLSGAVLMLVRGMDLLCDAIPGLYDELDRRGDLHRLRDGARAAYAIRADLGLGPPTEEHLPILIGSWPRILGDLVEIEDWYASRRAWDGDPCAGMVLHDLVFAMQNSLVPFQAGDELRELIEETASANGRRGTWESLVQQCRSVRTTNRPSVLLSVVYLLTEGDECRQQ